MSAEPVIIIGMHRSGTTMLVDILEDNGFYFGNAYGKNKEAHPFLALHEKVLRIHGCSWDNPSEFLNFIKCEKRLDTIRSALKKEIDGANFTAFFKNTRTLWGWKDPRNSLFLKCWNIIYPNAKYIYIYRNPVDVAKSLEKRALAEELNINEQTKLRHSLSLLLNKIKGKSEYYLNSQLCQSFDYSFKLWEIYNEECLNFLDCIESEKYIKLKYEDFVTGSEGLNKLSVFLDKKLEVDKSFFKPERANANNCTEKISKNSTLWRKLGYE